MSHKNVGACRGNKMSHVRRRGREREWKYPAILHDHPEGKRVGAHSLIKCGNNGGVNLEFCRTKLLNFWIEYRNYDSPLFPANNLSICQDFYSATSQPFVVEKKERERETIYC